MPYKVSASISTVQLPRTPIHKHCKGCDNSGISAKIAIATLCAAGRTIYRRVSHQTWACVAVYVMHLKGICEVHYGQQLQLHAEWSGLHGVLQGVVKELVSTALVPVVSVPDHLREERAHTIIWKVTGRPTPRSQTHNAPSSRSIIQKRTVPLLLALMLCALLPARSKRLWRPQPLLQPCTPRAQLAMALAFACDNPCVGDPHRDRHEGLGGHRLL